MAECNQDISKELDCELDALLEPLEPKTDDQMTKQDGETDEAENTLLVFKTNAKKLPENFGGVTVPGGNLIPQLLGKETQPAVPNDSIDLQKTVDSPSYDSDASQQSTSSETRSIQSATSPENTEQYTITEDVHHQEPQLPSLDDTKEDGFTQQLFQTVPLLNEAATVVESNNQEEMPEIEPQKDSNDAQINENEDSSTLIPNHPAIIAETESPTEMLVVQQLKTAESTSVVLNDSISNIVNDKYSAMFFHVAATHIASIMKTHREEENPLSKQSDQEENPNCFKKKVCCTNVCTKERRARAKSGLKAFVSFWTSGLYPRWRFISNILRTLFYLGLIGFTVGKIAYDSRTRGNPLDIFDICIFIVGVIGKIIAISYVIVFCIRRCKESKKLCKDLCNRCCNCCQNVTKKMCCRSDRVSGIGSRINRKGYEEIGSDIRTPDSRTSALAPEERRLEEGEDALAGKRGRIKVIFWNFFEIILSVIHEILGTIALVLTLYSFIGDGDFFLFYNFFGWVRLFSLVNLIISILFLVIPNHIIRWISIGRNLMRMDRQLFTTTKRRERAEKQLDEPMIQEEANVKLTRSHALVHFFKSFQWRLMAHVVLHSIYHIFSLFVLSWKIINDQCNLNINIIFPKNITNHVYCSLPTVQTVSPFTIYNIAYVVLIGPALAYTVFFLSNSTWLLRYLALFTRLSLYKTKQFLENKDVKHPEEMHYHPVMLLLQIITGNTLIHDISEEMLREKSNCIQLEIENIETDLQVNERKEIKDFSIDELMKILQFFPAAACGVVHVLLFLLHVAFLFCGYNRNGELMCYRPYSIIYLSQSGMVILVGLAVILIFLFSIIGVPGNCVGGFWLFLVLAIIIVIAVILGFIAAVITLIILIGACGGSSSTSNRRRRY